MEQAKRAPGVAFVVTGADLVGHCKEFTSDGVAHNRAGHKVPPQYPMAAEIAHWQGQPVVAVLANSRAEAEDAAELVNVQWEELTPILDGATALRSAPIHKSLSDNLAYEHNIKTGDPGWRISRRLPTCSSTRSIFTGRPGFRSSRAV